MITALWKSLSWRLASSQAVTVWTAAHQIFMCDTEIFRLRVNHPPRSRNNRSFERTSRRPRELKPKPTQTLTPSAHSSVHWRFVLVTAVVLRAVTATETLWPCWLGPRLRREVEICCQLVTKIHQLSVLISLWAAGASADSRVDRFLLVVLCKHVRLPFPLCSPAERPQIFTAWVKHRRAADGTTTTQSGPKPWTSDGLPDEPGWWMAPVVWINGFPAAAAVFTESSDKLELRSAAKELRLLVRSFSTADLWDDHFRDYERGTGQQSQLTLGVDRFPVSEFNTMLKSVHVRLSMHLKYQTQSCLLCLFPVLFLS